MLEWATILRLLNAAGCAVGLLFLSSAAYNQWRSWNDKTKDHWWALLGWVFLGLEGAIESLILNTQPGPRVIIQTLVVAWTLKALTNRQELRAAPAFQRRDKND